MPSFTNSHPLSHSLSYKLREALGPQKDPSALVWTHRASDFGEHFNPSQKLIFFFPRLQTSLPLVSIRIISLCTTESTPRKHERRVTGEELKKILLLSPVLGILGQKVKKTGFCVLPRRTLCTLETMSNFLPYPRRSNSKLETYSVNLNCCPILLVIVSIQGTADYRLFCI